MQLIRPGVTMFNGVTNAWVDDAAVVKKFGVLPHKVIDVQALMGDTTDNVPGVPGIGVMTAAELITTYGNLETVLANANFIKQKARRDSLLAHAQQAILSKQLVTLDSDVPLVDGEDGPGCLGQIELRPCDYGALYAYLEKMEFRSLRQRIEESHRQ